MNLLNESTTITMNLSQTEIMVGWIAMMVIGCLSILGMLWIGAHCSLHSTQKSTRRITSSIVPTEWSTDETANPIFRKR